MYVLDLLPVVVAHLLVAVLLVAPLALFLVVAHRAPVAAAQAHAVVVLALLAQLLPAVVPLALALPSAAVARSVGLTVMVTK